MKNALKTTFVAVAMITALQPTAFAQKFTTSVSPEVVDVGQRFRVEYRYEYEDEKDSVGTGTDCLSTPRFPDGVEVLYGPSVSTGSYYRIMNGEESRGRSVSYSYSLKLTKEGNVAIPAATLKVGDRTLTTNTAKVRHVSDVTDEEQYAIYTPKSGYWITQVAESDNRLYLMEPENGNNAVLYIDKWTGKAGEVIEGIEGIFEDVRPSIQQIGASWNDKLFFSMHKYDPWHSSDNEALYVYDGKSAETSRLLWNVENWGISPHGMYLFTRSIRNGKISVYDANSLELKKEYNGIPYKIIISDDGTLWNKENMTFMTLEDDTWKKLKNSELIDGVGIYNDPVVFLYNRDLYVSWKRRIYRVENDIIERFFGKGDNYKLVEVAKVPRTERWSFSDFVATGRGDILTKVHFEGENDYWGGCFVRFTEASTEKFTRLDHSFVTAIKTNNALGLGLSGFHVIEGGRYYVDHNDNIIFLDGNISIYNRYGIKGYNAGINKQTTIDQTLWKEKRNY